jgi:biotin operon repressor
LGGIVDTSKNGLDNIIASSKSSDIGQAIQKVFGGSEQSIRNDIKTLRTWGLLAIKEAADLGTTSMNTAAEMEKFLALATDTKTDLQANMNALKMFEEMYGMALETPEGTHRAKKQESGLSDEKRKRLEFLRKKKAEGKL